MLCLIITEFAFSSPVEETSPSCKPALPFIFRFLWHAGTQTSTTDAATDPTEPQTVCVSSLRRPRTSQPACDVPQPCVWKHIKDPLRNCRRGRCNRAAVSLAERPPCTQDAAVCCHCLFIFGVLCCVVVVVVVLLKHVFQHIFETSFQGNSEPDEFTGIKKSNKAKVYLFIFISGINKADLLRRSILKPVIIPLNCVPITQSIDIWDDKYIFIIPDLTAFEGTTCVSASLSSNQGRRRRPKANWRRLSLC